MANRILTDHDEIRAWAEARGGKPAQVTRTARGDEPGIIRIDFPGYSGEGSLEEISWDEWFRKFDESGLALVVQDRTRGGQLSNFNKLVARETAAARQRGLRTSRRATRTAGRGASARRGRSAKPAARRKAGAKSAARRRTRTATAGKASRRGTARRATGRSTTGRKTARAASAARTARSRGTTARGGSSSRRTGSSRSTSKTGSRSGGGTRRGAGRATRRR